MHAWRIIRSAFADEAFKGTGASLSPGRWNLTGVPMVYTAGSRALAAMEYFVHIDRRVAPTDLVLIGVEISGEVRQAELPGAWREDKTMTREYGSTWAASGKSVALLVPSAVVQGEWNVLLNPAHPAFKKVKIGKPEPFRFDVRMFGK